MAFWDSHREVLLMMGLFSERPATPEAKHHAYWAKDTNQLFFSDNDLVWQEVGGSAVTLPLPTADGGLGVDASGWPNDAIAYFQLVSGTYEATSIMCSINRSSSKPTTSYSSLYGWQVGSLIVTTDGHCYICTDATPLAAVWKRFAGTFTGDAGAGGLEGLVPAPAAGDNHANRFLSAYGYWEEPMDRAVYDVDINVYPDRQLVLQDKFETTAQVNLYGPIIVQDADGQMVVGGNGEYIDFPMVDDVSQIATPDAGQTAIFANGAGQLCLMDENRNVNMLTQEGIVLRALTAIPTATNDWSFDVSGYDYDYYEFFVLARTSDAAASNSLAIWVDSTTGRPSGSTYQYHYFAFYTANTGIGNTGTNQTALLSAYGAVGSAALATERGFNHFYIALPNKQQGPLMLFGESGNWTAISGAGVKRMAFNGSTATLYNMLRSIHIGLWTPTSAQLTTDTLICVVGHYGRPPEQAEKVWLLE